MAESFPCGWCHCDPVRKGRVCCPEHNVVVCAGCRGTDAYLNAHRPKCPIPVSNRETSD